MYYVKSKSSRRSSLLRPSLFDDPDYEVDEQIVFPIVVEDSPDVDTGLVDDDGNTIMRSDRVPLGFLADLLPEDDA